MLESDEECSDSDGEIRKEGKKHHSRAADQTNHGTAIMTLGVSHPLKTEVSVVAGPVTRTERCQSETLTKRSLSRGVEAKGGVAQFVRCFDSFGLPVAYPGC